MSLREVSSSTPFLAKKGGAAPANPGAARGGPAGPSLRPIESEGEISLESAPAEATAGVAANAAKAGAAGKRTAETAPAASLLPFDLLRKKYRPDAVPDLVDDEPDIAPMDFVAISELEPEPKQQAELALRVKSDAAAEPKSDPTVDARPALELKAPAPLESEAGPHLDAPTLTPEWRVGVEAPAQPKIASAKIASAKSTPAKSAPDGGWLLPLGGLAAAFAALVVGWNMTNPDFDLGSWLAPEPAVRSESVSEVAAPIAVEPPPPIAESPVAAAPPAPVEPEAPVPLESSAPPESPMANLAVVEPETTTPTSLQANLPEPVLSPPAGSTADGAGTPTSVQAPVETPAVETPAVELPVKPTVDVVRLEANGEAVIAGRAAPNSELIVLDNGEPIGTVQADAFGEWVFVPEAALPIGDHEFALVVKTVQESVSLPAPDIPSLPPAPDLEPALAVPESDPAVPSDAALDTGVPDIAVPETAVPDIATPDTGIKVAPAVGGDETAAQPIPVPMRKPEPADVSADPADAQAEPPAPSQQASLQQGVPAANTAEFVVQLASVKTRAGAEQEWRKLKQKFPEILSDMVPALDEVKLVDYGTVIRVRTGAFSSQRDAATLCAQLAEKNQACLVVKTSGGN